MATLFAISEELLMLQALAESADSPEQSRLVDEWLAENQTDLYEKIDAYCALIRKLEGESEMVKDEAKRLAAHAKPSERLAKTLRDRLAFVLAQIAPEGIKTARNTIAVSHTKPKLKLDEHTLPQDLPVQFQIKTTLIEPNWEEIEWAIREGEVIPGVISVGGTPFVKIR